MKIGIYIDGLGQSVPFQSVTDYATRLKNEMDSHTEGVKHELTVEKIKYTTNRASTVVSIVGTKNGQSSLLYKLYDFRYKEILTDRFNKQNILIRNILLFLVVIKKIPILLFRFFKPTTYNRPFQTFYIFFLFFIIAAAILFMVPATLNVIMNIFFEDTFVSYVRSHPKLLAFAHSLGVTHANLKNFTEGFVSFIAVVLLLAPQANTIVISLATEFVCANNYLQFGQQKQEILGNIDRLMEYISENEKDAKVQFHSYSYGSLIAIDYLFPYGTAPSGNMLDRTEALITIGTPFDFISSYYRGYYSERNTTLESKIKWLNIYSVVDALGSNFRNDSKIGEAQYGITATGLKPDNISYEVMKINEYSFSNFIMLNSLRVHGMYWSPDTDGQSCLKPIYLKMKENSLL